MQQPVEASGNGQFPVYYFARDMSEESLGHGSVLFVSSACAGAGGGSGGVPFEVWCRFYHPNVRDQVIAKVCLLNTLMYAFKATYSDLSSTDVSCGNRLKPYKCVG